MEFQRPEPQGLPFPRALRDDLSEVDGAAVFFAKSGPPPPVCCRGPRSAGDQAILNYHMTGGRTRGRE